jgi:two-component system chemotaxis sensor kinase CheA
MTINIEFMGIFLDELTDTIGLWNECLAQGEDSSGATQEILQTLFRCAHNLKGSSKSVGLNGVAEFIHKVEDYITLMRDGKLPFSSESSIILSDVSHELRAWGDDLRANPTRLENQSRNCDEILGRIRNASGATDPRIAPAPSPTAGEGTASEANSSGIIWTDSLVEKDLPPETSTPSQANIEAPKERQAAYVPVETVRVRRTSIEMALAQLAELSLEISRLRSSKQLGFNEAIELEKIVSVTHRTVFGTIQGTVEELFHFLQHTCTDVAKKTNKRIRVTVSGSDVMLDKKILEQIKDPLMHVVRNAVDHGIELPQVRLESGKDEVGEVRLRALKSPRGVWIEVHDDGKGLDARRLRAKAVEKKFISGDAVMSDKECFDLIFLAGFSTAGTVNQFSGRGVGMDVVKKAIEQVDGKIDIESSLGKGSVFRLFIPAVSSLLDVFIVREGNSDFGVTDNGVAEILEFENERLGENPTTGLTYRYGDEQIPLLPLHAILGFDKPDASRYVIVSKQKDGNFGILVEDISSLQQHLVQQPEETFQSVEGLIGTTRLESGKATFVLDIDEILVSRMRLGSDAKKPSELLRAVG